MGNALNGNLLLLVIITGAEAAYGASSGQSVASISATQTPHGTLKIPCQNCHEPAAWMPIRNHPEFDHNKTSYPLRGLHTTVPCQDCHVDRVFGKAPSHCPDCHADIHRRRNGAECGLCHRVTGWQVSIHNINEHQDRFPLIGAHGAVDCYSCHRVGAVGQFNRQGLSSECISCHLRAFQKTRSPNHQARGFSVDCRQCHNMDSWMIPAASRARFRR